MILKLIIFFIAIGWVLSSLVKFFLRSKLKQFVDQVNETQRAEASRRTRPKDGNVNVDYVPKGRNSSGGKGQGGEYIDYEEVKD
ncbi:hypothetical protein ADIS_1739 [Lunatimonas lonarensis]|uniref:DUF4834 domain-containing protein n=1 Tax=Lunatimonas lonarensis TaxID=1232681 RepID=R7ZUJ2_9BACT|nr:DUF4834 family protein [Lunatimonas lonarensis]EON77820.1 hypothetical protein ADIS_1739 [Lunatimonas lonarensis]